MTKLSTKLKEEFFKLLPPTIFFFVALHIVAFVTKYQFAADGKPELLREAKLLFIDDGPGKAEGINTFIGRRPIFAFGNSDGDKQMLEWTAAGNGPRFMALVHHTDAEREWAYDRKSDIGKLDKAWDEAVAQGWTVVSMKDDWKTIFPPTKQ